MRCRHFGTLAALYTATLLGFGCSKDSNPVAPPPPAKGMLFLRVLDSSQNAVPGTAVLLAPSGRADTTDALGTVYLRDLDPGNYTVLASKRPIGSNKAVATVRSDEVANVMLTLVPNIFFEPSVRISSPRVVLDYSYVDTIAFLGSVADLEDSAPTLSLVWSSNRDGVLSTQAATATGVTRVVTDALSLGDHWIRLLATDSDQRIGADSVLLHVRSFPPSASIARSFPPQEFAPGEIISLSGTLGDRETRSGDLHVAWTSDLDGPLGSGTLTTNGTTLATRDLSPGTHWITLAVTDGDGLQARDSVQVRNILPNAITLEPPVPAAGRVQLRWSSARPGNFARYEVYRSTSAGIQRSIDPWRTFTSITDTVWTDSLPPFAANVYYRVFVVNGSSLARGTEERAVASPGGLILSNVSVDDAVIHPSQPWVYLHERSTGKITIVDYRAMNVVLTATVSGGTGFLDLADNGSGLGLLVPRSDGWVDVRDPADLHLISQINTGLRNASAIADGRGHVLVSTSPSPWWDRPLRSYRSSDGTYIDGDGDFDFTRLKLLQSGREIIEITMSVSPIDMDWYRLDDSGGIVSHVNDIPHGGPPLDPTLYRVSPGLNYVVTSSSGAVYRADSTMAYLGSFPRGSLTFGDFAFSADGSQCFAGTSNDRTVQVYGFPGLAQSGYLLTRGYPRFLWRVGNELISVSRLTSDGSFFSPFSVGFEIIPIPATATGAYPAMNSPRKPGPEHRRMTAVARPPRTAQR